MMWKLKNKKQNSHQLEGWSTAADPDPRPPWKGAKQEAICLQGGRPSSTLAILRLNVLQMQGAHCM